MTRCDVRDCHTRAAWDLVCALGCHHTMACPRHLDGLAIRIDSRCGSGVIQRPATTPASPESDQLELGDIA